MTVRRLRMQCSLAFVDTVQLGTCESSKHLEKTSEESIVRRSTFDVAIDSTSLLDLRSCKGKLSEDLFTSNRFG